MYKCLVGASASAFSDADLEVSHQKSLNKQQSLQKKSLKLAKKKKISPSLEAFFCGKKKKRIKQEMEKLFFKSALMEQTFTSQGWSAVSAAYIFLEVPFLHVEMAESNIIITSWNVNVKTIHLIATHLFKLSSISDLWLLQDCSIYSLLITPINDDLMWTRHDVSMLCGAWVIE